MNAAVVISRDVITLWAKNMLHILENRDVSFSMAFPDASDVLVMIKGKTLKEATGLATAVEQWKVQNGPEAKLQPLRTILTSVVADGGQPVLENRFFTAWWVYKALQYVRDGNKAAVWGMLDCHLPGFSVPVMSLQPDESRDDALRFKSREYSTEVVRALRKWCDWKSRRGKEDALVVNPFRPPFRPLAIINLLGLDPAPPSPTLSDILQEEYLTKILSLPSNSRVLNQHKVLFLQSEKYLYTPLTAGVSSLIKSRVELWMEHGHSRFFKRYLDASIGIKTLSSCYIPATFPIDANVQYRNERAAVPTRRAWPKNVLLDSAYRQPEDAIQRPVDRDVYAIDFTTFTAATLNSTKAVAQLPAKPQLTQEEVRRQRLGRFS